MSYYDSSLVKRQNDPKSGYYPHRSAVDTVHIADDEFGTKFTEDVYLDVEFPLDDGQNPTRIHQPPLRIGTSYFDPRALKANYAVSQPPRKRV